MLLFAIISISADLDVNDMTDGIYAVDKEAGLTEKCGNILEYGFDKNLQTAIASLHATIMIIYCFRAAYIDVCCATTKLYSGFVKFQSYF